MRTQLDKPVTPAQMRATLTEWFRAHAAPVPIDAPLAELRKWRRKDQKRRDAADVDLWCMATHLALQMRKAKP